MRKEPTDGEKAFWEMAKSGAFDSKFRRQHIIGDYIVDFVCLEKHLVVEIDGGYHQEEPQQIDDNLRSTELKNHGFAILRLCNEEVIGNPQEVIRKVKLALWLAEKVPLREGFREAADTLVYTGAIDEFFGYKYGKLDWRTVSFKTRVEDTANYQGNAVVNYTSHDVPYTRVIEHKHFEMFGQEVYDCPKTIVSEEYSTEYKEGMEPYYPVNDARNNELADKYRQLAHQEGVAFPEDLYSLPTGEGRGGAVIFGGRLAEYKYYDMAPIVEKVLNMF
jgi:very-short-patch-repair endonuclease